MWNRIKTIEFKLSTQEAFCVLFFGWFCCAALCYAGVTDYRQSRVSFYDPDVAYRMTHKQIDAGRHRGYVMPSIPVAPGTTLYRMREAKGEIKPTKVLTVQAANGGVLSLSDGSIFPEAALMQSREYWVKR